MSILDMLARGASAYLYMMLYMLTQDVLDMPSGRCATAAHADNGMVCSTFLTLSQLTISLMPNWKQRPQHQYHVCPTLRHLT